MHSSILRWGPKDKYLVNASKIPASAMFSGFSAASIANSPSAKRGASGLSELGVNNFNQSWNHFSCSRTCFNVTFPE